MLFKQEWKISIAPTNQQLFLVIVKFPAQAHQILHWLLFEASNYTDANGLVKIVPTHGQNGSIAFANSNAEELSFLITNTEWSEIPND